MILIFVTATVVPAVKSCLAGEYVEGGLYAGIFGTLMFFVARLMVKSLNEVKRENLHVLKECEEQGIDVIEYNKRINDELRSNGFDVIELDYSEPAKLGGAFRCGTCPLERL